MTPSLPKLGSEGDARCSAHRFSPTADLALDEMPMLVPVPREVLIRVSARGPNRCDSEFVRGVYAGVASVDAGTGNQIFPQSSGFLNPSA